MVRFHWSHSIFRILSFAFPLGATINKFITGKVTFDGPKDIQAGSNVEITLQDVSLMDAPAKTIGTLRITNARSFPISYKVKYDLSEIKNGHRYTMSARITGPDGKLHYINDMSITADVGRTKEPTIDIPVIKSKQILKWFPNSKFLLSWWPFNWYKQKNGH